MPAPWLEGFRQQNRRKPIDANGNQTVVSSPAEITTMAYDKENRMLTSKAGAAITTYSYGTNEMKAIEQSGSTTTDLIWDGSEYLGGKI